jgi:hypothetical protein
MPSRLPFVACCVGFVGLSTAASCGGPRVFARPTTASVARSDDPWLVGDRCSPSTPTEPLLHSEILAEGTGAVVTTGATVRVHYTASLADGTALHDTENMPSELVLGSTKTICGFERAVVGMRAGEQRRVVVPWQLAFGEAGRPPEIPPRSDLTFVIDLYLPADVVRSFGAPPVNPMGGRRQ